MKRALTLLLCLLVWVSGLTAQTVPFPPDPDGPRRAFSDAAKASVLTCSPGRQLYSAFGHTAIRVTDLAADPPLDKVFNYGTFQFSDGFYVRFVQGELIYSLSTSTYGGFLDEYIRSGRGVEEQRLDLDAEDIAELYAYLQANAHPDHRDYRYLLGYGALGTEDPELAMRAFEWFLLHAEDDERKGPVYVMLAEAYFAEGRFLEGRAAAVEARRRYLPHMAETWRERALKIWARTGLALGHKEEAFLELEQLVIRGDEPELALFLMDELLADRQWQRAMAVGRGFLGRRDEFGDAARFRQVQALYAQARAGGHLADFPAQAIPLAPKVQDQDLRRQIATMIGEAYTELEMLEHAADAFRGILR